MGRGRSEDLTGRVFENITVVSFDEKLSVLKGRSHYLQRCVCGKEWVGRVDKRNTSCGCQKGKKNQRYFGDHQQQFAKWRRNKKKHPLGWDLEFEDLDFPTHCPLLGMELNYNGGQGQSFNNASLDRIDSSKGYVKGNVLVISHYANQIKNCADLPTLEMLVENLRKLLSENTHTVSD